MPKPTLENDMPATYWAIPMSFRQVIQLSLTEPRKLRPIISIDLRLRVSDSSPDPLAVSYTHLDVYKRQTGAEYRKSGYSALFTFIFHALATPNGIIFNNAKWIKIVLGSVCRICIG